jgi:hypothetical protein
MTKSKADPVYDEVECQHCTGDGCCFCDAQGRVFVKHPAQKCRHCQGIGCFYCGYTGWDNLKGKYD